MQGWFGLTGMHFNVWLKFGRRMLYKALSSVKEVLPTWPSAERIQQMKDAVIEKHDHLHDVFCVADGLKVHFQQSSNVNIQAMYYNGWTHGHYITNLFVFGIDGRIIKSVINVPGSVHDSTLCKWGGIYDDLEKIYNETGGKCCVDSAFAANPNPYLVKSSQDLNDAANATELIHNRQATSLRQAAEWGMRALQGAFPRLKDTV